MVLQTGAQCCGEDFVLAPEPRQQGKTGQGQGAAQECPVCGGQELAKPAEAAHVDDVAHGMHDAAGAQKQQGLEKRMRVQVENRCHHCHRHERNRITGRGRADG